MNEFPSEIEMQRIIDQQLKAMDSGLRDYALSKLVPLKIKTLKWEYGNDEEFPAWIFADFGERNVAAAYCLGGFGTSGHCWGLIFTDNDYFGMDSGWYFSIKELLTDGWCESCY